MILSNVYFRFLLPYLVSFIVLLCLITFAIVPLLRKFRANRCKKLRYAQWLYVDEEPNGRYNGKVRLSDSIAVYALDRYPKECNVQPWHVFVRTSVGTPLAVKFDRDTYIIESTRRLTQNDLNGKRLRAVAKCSNEPIESQFENIRETDNDLDETRKRRQRTALRQLAKRYRYEVRFDRDTDESGNETSNNGNANKSDNHRHLVIEFTDVKVNRKYKFTIDSFRPTFDPNDDKSSLQIGQQRLPDEWTLSRKSTARPISFDTSAVNDSSVANLTSGVRSYEASPCFDSKLGKRTVGKRAITSLREFARLYMRDIVSYPDRQDLKDKLKRLYWDCVYDTNTNKDLLEDELISAELFPIVTYLQICPDDRSYFDAKLRKCVVT